MKSFDYNNKVNKRGHLAEMIARQVKNNTRYAQIEESLRRNILAGKYPEDAALPGEIQLSSEYSVSRKTVRKALENLRAQNFIRKTRGSGNFVIPAAERDQMKRVAGKLRLILPNDWGSNGFVCEIVTGVHKFAAGRGLEITFGVHGDSEKALIDAYRNFRCDALIWCACPHSLLPSVTALGALRIPQIIIDGEAPGTGAVIYDSLPAWRSLFNMLSAAGHRAVAFIERKGTMSWALSRQEAMLRAALEYDMTSSVFTEEFDAVDALERFVRSHPEITAYVSIMLWNNALKQVFERCGKSVPLDVSWVEFTPEGIAQESPMTAIHIPAQSMGYEAARLAADNDFLSNPTPFSAIPCFTTAGLTTGAAPRIKVDFSTGGGCGLLPKY